MCTELADTIDSDKQSVEQLDTYLFTVFLFIGVYIYACYLNIFTSSCVTSVLRTVFSSACSYYNCTYATKFKYTRYVCVYTYNSIKILLKITTTPLIMPNNSKPLL